MAQGYLGGAVKGVLVDLGAGNNTVAPKMINFLNTEEAVDNSVYDFPFRSAFGYLEHASILLLPSYRQKVKRGRLVRWTIQEQSSQAPL